MPLAEDEELAWPEPLFPFLLVSMGTGVSILRVDSEEEGGFTRIAGTACGGGTFLGLRVSEQDVARSLLRMVTQQSTLLSLALAQHHGCIDRVFFVGGFVEQENHIAREAISASLRSLGGRVYFVRHSDCLGFLGSLCSCLREQFL